MAEAIVSVVLEQLASITIKQIEQEVELIVGVDNEVENLIFHLSAVQAVLQDAEVRQVNEANVRSWVHNLEDLSYQINDVLDEWNTEILKDQLERQESDDVDNAVTKRKVRCSFIPSPIICFRKVCHAIIMRRDIGKRIKEINERLTKIAMLRQNYQFQFQSQGTIRGTQQIERHDTSSFVSISAVVGRKADKQRLISMLQSESSQKEWGQFVIPIVGMGGLGKTTFAQFVYNDEIVKKHFDFKIWVCVSDPFKLVTISKSIVGQLVDGYEVKRKVNKDYSPNVKLETYKTNSEDLETLLKHISELIDGKKFVLVLDDVWGPTEAEWNQLKVTLQEKSDKCSRILVTTRNVKVAIMMGATTNQTMSLDKLADDDCLQLFRDIAFYGRESDDQRKFLDVENKRKIVKKCNGLPLIAKTLGSYLRYKKTNREWVDALDSKIWEIDEVEKEVFQSTLLLSYYDLTPPVRRCLLYCAIFPKDFEFDKDDLINLWMSQDYLSTKGDKNKETILGQMYFDNLVMRSFFQDFGRSDSGNIDRCKMHDIVHDFVQFMTQNEIFIKDVESRSDKNKIAGNKFRHLNLMSTWDDSLLNSVFKYKRLRTLLASNMNKDMYSKLNSDLLLKLKGLRTLNLSNNSIEELPNNIDVLIHLRYLDLSCNYDLCTLPDTVGNLYNLQTLRLMWCQKLKSLPATIKKLINLKALQNRHCDSLEMPKEIGSLRSLQTIDDIALFESDGGFKLVDLSNLEQLRGHIRMSNLTIVKDMSEQIKEKKVFVNKTNLLSLDLSFRNDSTGWSDEEDDDVIKKEEDLLEALQPPMNVEALNIWYYKGRSLHPSWIMSLPNLKKLHLGYLLNCQFSHHIANLPCLEELLVYGMKALIKLGNEFLGIIDGKTPQTFVSFPTLKRLIIADWENLKEWEGPEDSEIKIMPSLSFFEMGACTKLKTLPAFLLKAPLLQELSIDGPPSLASGCKTGRGKEWKRVSHILNIKIDDKYVQKDGVRTDVYDGDEWYPPTHNNSSLPTAKPRRCPPTSLLQPSTTHSVSGAYLDAELGHFVQPKGC